MKFLGMVLRNARRNPIRSFLTVASLAVSLSLAMVLISFQTINGEMMESVRGFHRIIVMSAQGFGQPVPYARVAEVQAMPGVGRRLAVLVVRRQVQRRGHAVRPVRRRPRPSLLPGLSTSSRSRPTSSRDWREDKAGCIIGRKLAEERKIKVGDPFPLKDGVYPCNLNLTVRGIYDGPSATATSGPATSTGTISTRD